LSNLAIIGAGGHGKVIAEIALALNSFKSIDFFDEKITEGDCVGSWSVRGGLESLILEKQRYSAVALGIGDNLARLRLFKQLTKLNFNLPNMIHPTAFVSPSVQLGEGNIICAGAIISSFTKVESACIFNTASSVDHDCNIESGVHISPGAHLAGNVEVKQAAWVGIGAVVREGGVVGSDSVIGAGAVVLGEVSQGTVVVGLPAKEYKGRKNEE